MRIRGSASKLLGSATARSDSPQLPPSPPGSSLVAAAGAVGSPGGVSADFCELNRSPWSGLDDLDGFLQPDFDGEHRTAVISKSEGQPVERQVIANGKKNSTARTRKKPAAEKPAPQRSTNSSGSGAVDVAVLKRKMARPPTPIDDVALLNPADLVVYCSKNDGKGWRCKRKACSPHHLCLYHLDKRSRLSAATANGRTNDDNERADSHDDGSMSIYYSEFGPWRSKQRSERTSGGRRAESSTRSSSALLTPGAIDEDGKVDDKGLQRQTGIAGGDEEGGSRTAKWLATMKKMGRGRRKAVKCRSIMSLL